MPSNKENCLIWNNIFLYTNNDLVVKPLNNDIYTAPANNSTISLQLLELQKSANKNGEEMNEQCFWQCFHDTIIHNIHSRDKEKLNLATIPKPTQIQFMKIVTQFPIFGIADEINSQSKGRRLQKNNFFSFFFIFFSFI